MSDKLRPSAGTKLTCGVCQQEFTRYTNLRIHFERRHPETNLPPRPPCQRKTTTARTAHEHHCNVCKQSFAYHYNLRKHVATRHPEINPPPPLNRGRKVKTSSVLAPVKCQCCDKTFASKGSALYHRRAAHHEIPKHLKGERRPEEKESLSFLSFAGK